MGKALLTGGALALTGAVLTGLAGSALAARATAAIVPTVARAPRGANGGNSLLLFLFLLFGLGLGQSAQGQRAAKREAPQQAGQTPPGARCGEGASEGIEARFFHW